MNNVLFFFWRYNNSLGISLSCLFLTVSELFCCELFETLALAIKSLVASAVFELLFLKRF